MRDQLIERIRPLTDRLASDLASLLEQKLGGIIAGFEEAFHVALSAAASDQPDSGGGAMVVETPTAVKKSHKRVRQRDYTPEVYPPSRRAREERAVPQANGHRPITCKKCGFVGGNSRGCGTAHPTRMKEARTAAAPAVPSNSDDSEDEPRASRRRRGPPPADAVERVIPHIALVAMLAADRANNAVGDVGTTVVRADREPSLVGHTEERREFCVRHGWVGRFGYEREHHDLCALSEADIPCRRCDGKKLTTTGSRTCRQCNGSGIEPEQLEAPVVAETEHPLAVAHVRLSQVERADGGRQRRKRTAERAYTIPMKKITREVLAKGQLEVELAGPAVEERRPVTRGECSPCSICQEYVDAKRSGFDRTAIRPAGRDREGHPASAVDRQPQLEVGSALQLRPDGPSARDQPTNGEHDELRMLADEARPVENGAVSAVVLDDQAVRADDVQGLPALRRTRHQGLHRVAGELRGVREGHGATPDESPHDRSQGLERRLRAGELPVGDYDSAAAEQAQQPADSSRGRNSHHVGVERDVGHPAVDDRHAVAARVEQLACGHRASEAWKRSRPCAYVACKAHLYLDVDPDTGSIKINFPDVEPEELLESCAIDIAERGGLTLEDTANLMNLTRERARQIERLGLHLMRNGCVDGGVGPQSQDDDSGEDAA